MGHLIDVNAKTEENAIPVNVSVTNVLGQTSNFQLATQLTNGSNIIELPDYLKGVYVIMIKEDNGKVITKKVVL